MANMFVGMCFIAGAMHFLITPVNVLGFGMCLSLACLFIVNAEF